MARIHTIIQRRTQLLAMFCKCSTTLRWRSPAAEPAEESRGRLPPEYPECSRIFTEHNSKARLSEKNTTSPPFHFQPTSNESSKIIKWIYKMPNKIGTSTYTTNHSVSCTLLKTNV